jgi:2-polyprenyl-3-methyl-5-hydroxy-6-metoxy-1,4-benzoquinol methylase
MVHIPELLPMPVWDEYYATLPVARECLQEQLLGSVSDAAVARDRDRFGRYIALMRTHDAALPGARLLDLGGYTGGSLRVAAEHGLEPFGVEGLAEAVRFAKERFPTLHLAHARTEQLDPDIFGGRFDVVTMWETLEHTFDPIGSLRLAAQALRPGGTLAVSVPNVRNVQFSALGQFCFYAYGGYHGTGHINMFSPDTLARALDEAGFDLIHSRTEFGTDWRQVLLYLRQQFDRIHCYANLVRHGDTTDKTGPELSVLLNWLSPALTRVENACLAGPIIVALARRR